jgi:cupin fold WbuC family metalloprotein
MVVRPSEPNRIMNLRKINDDVYYADDAVVRWGPEEIEFVRRRAAESPRRRARICGHRDPADRLHEMIIGLDRRGYVQPHKHRDRAESFHVFAGSADVVIFDDAGAVRDVLTLGDGPTDLSYYRLNTSTFHTVLVRSPTFVVHETTLGPFDTGDTEFAPWAPKESETEKIAVFLERIERELTDRPRK